MVQISSSVQTNNAASGIAFILLGMTAISVNDVLIKQLSGDYPLHQLVFTRSFIGLLFSLILVQMEGGFAILRTKRPLLHATRGMLIVVSNLCYFTAFAAISLAEATALFFVAPLLITLLSIPMLGEKVGPLRLGAVVVGFCGVILMVRPWERPDERDVHLLILLLPVFGAFTYALNQILTRKLGMTSKASALAVYVQLTFIVVSMGFFAVAGDGRFAEGTENPSLLFLLRAWAWPPRADIIWMAGLGFNAAIVGYALAQAYRLADAATIAPFEYIGLPLAVFWGWLIFDELPGASVSAGIALIMGAGVFVFIRERQKKRTLIAAKPVHRRY